MRVLVDARGIGFSGIGRYLREVVVRLTRDDRFGRLILLGSRRELVEFTQSQSIPQDRVELLDFDYPIYSLSAQLAWLRFRRQRSPADVSFFPHYDAPSVAMPPRSVVTIHDLIHFKAPEGFPVAKRALAGLLLRRVVSQAGRILTGSAATREDVAERFPQFASKLHVVAQGVDSYFHPVPDGSGPADQAGGIVPNAPFLLCVGNRKSHKNLVGAVEAFALLRDVRPDLLLVVVGRVFEGWNDAVRLAAKRGMRDRIVDYEIASDADLRDLYRSCEALLFPSFYEGFGLPVLEAMACGAPVIASDRASIPEVAGDAAILVDPTDYRAMAEAVQGLQRNPTLRNEQIRKGLERATRFTWDATAKQTADHLASVARGVSR